MLSNIPDTLRLNVLTFCKCLLKCDLSNAFVKRVQSGAATFDTSAPTYVPTDLPTYLPTYLPVH